MNILTVSNEEVFVIRCGIIPYCKINNNEYKILLGLKSNYGKYYGDLGGGIKRTETYIDGLWREVFEESSTLIFKDKDDFLRRLKESKSTIYRTKNKAIKTIYKEYLIEIPFSNNYSNDFLNYGIPEHLELRWFNVKNSKIVNFNIETQLDAPIRPLIYKILEKLR